MDTRSKEGGFLHARAARSAGNPNMRAMPVATLLVLAIALSAPADAATVFSASGSFTVGSPVAWAVVDACGNGGATEGVDSNCVTLAAGLDGLAYAAAATDDTGTLLDLAPCFYDAAGEFLECGLATGTVPAGATSLAMASLGGVNVAWTFTVDG